MLVHMLAPDRERPGSSGRIIWSYPKYRLLSRQQQAFESTALFAGQRVEPDRFADRRNAHPRRAGRGQLLRRRSA